MALNKFIPTSPDLDIVQDSDLAPARFGHLNRLVDETNTELQTLPETVRKNLTYPQITPGPSLNLNNTGKNWDDGAIWGDVGYFWSNQDNKTFLYDFSDPDNIVQAYEFTDGNTRPYSNGLIEDRYLYARMNPASNAFVIWDISNPYSPVLVSKISTPVLSYGDAPLQRVGNWILGNSQKGHFAIDISDKTNPIYKSLDISNSYSDTTGYNYLDNYLIILDSRTPTTNKLYSIDWDTLEITLVLNQTDLFNGFKCYGLRYAGYNRFVGIGSQPTDNGNIAAIRTFKITNNQITAVSDYVPITTGISGPGDNLRVIGKYVITAPVSTNKIEVFDISDFAKPVLVQVVSTAFSNSRHINSDMTKAVIASRSYPGIIQILNINSFKPAVIEAGELSSQEMYVGDAYINGLAATGIYGTNLGAENAKVVNLNASKKFLYPKYTTAERTALTAEAGEAVYDTDTNKLYVYDGTTWQATW